MQTDLPPILQYASPPRVIAARPSAALLFGCGVLFSCCTLFAVQLVLGQIDIPIGPLCGCVMIPFFAAVVFHLAAGIRTKIQNAKLDQRNWYAIFGLGIAAFAAALVGGFLGDELNRSDLSGIIFLAIGVIGSAVSGLAAFRRPLTVA